MVDTYLYRSTLRKLSLSGSDTDSLNSTVNPRGNPSQFIPPDWAELNPNVSVSVFFGKTPYRGPGTRLQLQQEGTEIRIAWATEHFEGLKGEITEWENLSQLLCIFLELIFHLQSYFEFKK